MHFGTKNVDNACSINFFFVILQSFIWLIMRKILLIAFLGLVWPFLTVSAFTVVLDPGHGGKDPGAVGKFSQEKDLNLSVALLTGKKLAEQFPDVKVVYTRSTDVFIPLQTRADIANKNNADLFISIHTNASENKAACGVETFVLGTEKAEKNLDVAMRENAVMKLEADYNTTYHGFDPNSIDSYIMFELLQNNYMDQSLQFATQVQNQFVGKLRRHNRGVQQASFWVLLKSACPSILFEIGFISNPDEEVFLNTDSAQNCMAQALVDAFAIYTHRQAVKQESVSAPGANQTNETQSTQNRDETISGQSRDNIESATPIQGTTQLEKTTYYALQICASRTVLEPNDPKLKGLVCEYRKVGDWYKYYAIIDTDRSKVVAKQKEIKDLFPDCWITKFEK